MPMVDVHEVRALMAALVSPLQRVVEDVPPRGRLIALLLAAAQFAASDLFTALLLLVLAAAVIDYGVGLSAAYATGLRFNPRRAHMGLLGKLTGVFLLFLIRALEWIALRHDLVDTHGAIAVAIAVALLLADLRSINRHREALGAAPIPILSAALDWMEGWVKSRIPPPPPGPGGTIGP